MTGENTFTNIDLLIRLGYHESAVRDIKSEFDKFEPRGYYRPDAPTRLIRLLVNGLNLENEDIFAILEKSDIMEEDKRNEQELLASCAAITQLGYILTGCIFQGVRAASSGPHVFLIWEGFSPGSKIFIGFSIDSIIVMDVQNLYDEKNNFYYHIIFTITWVWCMVNWDIMRKPSRNLISL